METLRIALIDDEQSMHDIVSHFCKKNTDYAIDLVWYDEVPTDLTPINKDNYALLLLDYHINDRTGLEVLQQLNESHSPNEDALGLPVIMLSSSNDIQMASEAIHYGISEFIPKKNLSADLLNSTINNVLYKNNLKLQLLETNKKLEESNQMLKLKSEEISNFYQVISHELKTPLTSTLEFIQIMRDGLAGELTADQKEYLDICHRNCKQLTQYINDLLEIGRISTGKYELNCAPVTIKFVVDEAINTSRVIASRKNITLTFETQTKDLRILVDEARVFQALLILINNAIKFSPENEVIKILLSEDSQAGFVEVAVIDHGCGIEKEHQKKIFDRLFQANTHPVGSNAGLGLGLYICKQIMQLHGGEVSVDSLPGKGSQFILKFPYQRS
ncbi:sensory box histidine kinase/response regulator [Legionella rubrilucens]|uniref:histidine kinase n=1 Tax=Legionella rubrilucens TaxID=458 RepID=A0A0W0Y1V7_9GAMM|nr:hybrid sensor histidine kinase/response regulator [Legionella rubrilucens]KTD50542.1 sensory box histidine kinase/response regulator [Legionella rubrilucens]